MKMAYRMLENGLEYKVAYIIQFDLVLLIKLIPSDGLRKNASRQLCDTEHIMSLTEFFT